ncbi:deaminase [Flavobacterium sp. J372]|uniref:anti-phage dCTP deaminase n=1 Tax=Flavobacterium sp. J372 TaxID=2898436 RepID=UPI00215190B6|nr:anti-phage dCTP deaminase [Flavobacterium sp. J372]MCR5861274.1 deaminase [Flavobacterium sp. J372]
MEALQLNQSGNTRVDNRSTSQRVKETFTDEIVIGICSQIGAKKQLVIDELEKCLKEYEYTIENIKLSDFINGFITQPSLQIGRTQHFSTLAQKIETGNSLRKKFGEDYLSNLAITKIANEKREFFNIKTQEDSTKIKSRRVCYIIDSIKHMSELNTFKDVYKDIFYLMSIYTPKEERISNLSAKQLSQDEAETLIDKDQYESNQYGQQVREVFVNADFFLRVDKNTEPELEKKVQRYVNLIFGYGIETPTLEERAMYEAKSAAVNSACLSRQVGASIMSSDGSLLSTGWNDVPKFGGNLYTCDSDTDNRCYVIGHCHNDSNKTSLVKYILEDIKANLDLNTILPIGNNIENEKHLEVKNKLLTFIKGSLDNSGIKNLIEFSRSVHAEMHAIINAGHMSGDKIKGGILFCTTYPCHSCARHIIAAGITKVYYIEPYVKSKAPELHNDSITEDEKITTKVQLLVFDGVSPRRYLNFLIKIGRERN